MKERFVMTKSARQFFDGITHITHKYKGIERMLLVIGEPGLGKTETAIKYLVNNPGSVFIRTCQLMTGPWLCQTILYELGQEPFHRSKKNLELIYEILMAKPRVIIFDEIDRFVRKPDILETIRDIHDIAHTPIVFIGEEIADKALAHNRRLYRRFVETIHFQKLDPDGVRDFISEMSDIRYQEDAVQKIASSTGGKISDIMTAIVHAERIARVNGVKAITAKDL
jgi:DNA transposition AAA+ family ATPase